jgi:GNAT superfamily N-acetyltransferase
VLRRALGSTRDARAVTALRADAGLATPDAIAASLASDEHGVTLVAEQGGRAVGLADVRWLRAAPSGPVSVAFVERLFVAVDARRQGVARALLDAARAEVEGREGDRHFVLAGPDDGQFLRAVGYVPSPSWIAYEPVPEAAPGAVVEIAPAPSVDTLTLAPGVTLRLDRAAPPPASVTRWNGALAVRTRLRDDLTDPSWSAENSVGTPEDDEGDGARFAPQTRALRELYLNRPATLRYDDATLRQVSDLGDDEGALTLAPEVGAFSLAPADEALFDVSLASLVALRRGVADALAGGAAGLRAVRVSPHVSLLFLAGAYAGWRVRDPLSQVRPMGWPEAREPAPLDARAREALASVLYDWMVIDASPRVAPAEASDPDEVAHMVSLRERARALAEGAREADECDPAPGVARDVAAHVFWSWGFYKVGA